MALVRHEPLLDQDQMELLRAALDPGELQAMLAQLPAAAADAMTAIRAALAADDLQQARKAAHVLKGFSSSFGAARLAAIAREIEQDLATTAEVTSHLPVLTEAIGATTAALTRMVERE
ncbi:Hpt domain-containing protein [Bradyrhizobium oligotrophicum]|uniref:Hpt domain-containing protein n=1 Tax=Bradyrhizobium oligotrophicum TaxID=44255 RepID=UPI003EB7217E